MSEMLQLNVVKTLKKVPLDDVQQITVVTTDSKGKVKVITTCETDQECADHLDAALDIYYPENFEIL